MSRITKTAVTVGKRPRGEGAAEVGLRGSLGGGEKLELAVLTHPSPVTGGKHTCRARDLAAARPRLELLEVERLLPAGVGYG